MTPRWTRELPAVPGWYWQRNAGRPPMVEYVYIADGVACVRTPRGWREPASEYGGEWAGPLPEPEEPR